MSGVDVFFVDDDAAAESNMLSKESEKTVTKQTSQIKNMPNENITNTYWEAEVYCQSIVHCNDLLSFHIHLIPVELLCGLHPF